MSASTDGKETFIATGVSCYYFTRSEQTDSQCELTATQSGCGFVNLTTTHLNLFYSVDRPQFIFEYVYTDCSGIHMLCVGYACSIAKRSSSRLFVNSLRDDVSKPRTKPERECSNVFRFTSVLPAFLEKKWPQIANTTNISEKNVKLCFENPRFELIEGFRINVSEFLLLLCRKFTVFYEHTSNNNNDNANFTNIQPC